MNAKIKASPAKPPTIPPTNLGVIVVGPELGVVPPPPPGAPLVGAAGPSRPPLPLPLPPKTPGSPARPPPPRTPADVVDRVKELDLVAVEVRNDELEVMAREVRLMNAADVEGDDDDGDDVTEDTVEFVVEVVAERTVVPV